MDLITHGLLGAAASQGVARKRELGVAAAIGFAAALLPDADTLIRSDQDPLLRLEYHRQFTHALIFIPAGGLVAATLLWLFFKRKVSFARLYLFATAAFATAGTLDACTSYGTQLLWPFSHERTAWRIVSIIDPLVTVMLACAVILAITRASRVPAAIGIGLAICYLLAGLFQRGQAEQAAYAVAAQRGHTIERLEVKPGLGNLLLWRSVYLAGGSWHVDAIRLGVSGENMLYAGGEVPIFHPAEAFPDLAPDSILYRDIERFRTYSEGFIAAHPDRPFVVGDLRYAMLPNSLKPLWGIVVDTSRPRQHADYRDFRDMDEEMAEAFLSMLFGAPAAASDRARMASGR